MMGYSLAVAAATALADCSASARTGCAGPEIQSSRMGTKRTTRHSRTAMPVNLTEMRQPRFCFCQRSMGPEINKRMSCHQDAIIEQSGCVAASPLQDL